MKTFLMLGAGLMQGVAIRAAKEMGYYVVVTDGDENAISRKFADRFENVDLQDLDGLVALAKRIQSERGLDAVFTAATDFSFAVATIAKACGLPSHTTESAKIANNKALLRYCLLKHGVNSPKFVQVVCSDLLIDNDNFDLKKVSNMLENHGIEFPVVVKPVDSMGARGCCKVSSLDELKAALHDAVGFSVSGNVIIEEFVEGIEFSIEGLVFDGEIFITAIADRHIFFPPYFIEMGHTIPSKYSKDVTDEVIRVFSDGVRAVGLTYGAIKGDIRFRDGRAYVGEIAGRLSGGYMSGWTVPYSSGIDITKDAILLASNEKPISIFREDIKLPPTKDNTKLFAAERAWISIPGVISKIYGMEDVKKIDGVKEVLSKVDTSVGVVFPKNNVEKCGNIIATAKTYEKAISIAESACRKIVLRLEIDAETDNFFEMFSLDVDIGGDYYPPNFVDFTNMDLKKILDELDPKKYTEQDGIICPTSFKDYLYTVCDLQGRSLDEALKQLFLVEKSLYDKLSDCISSNDKLVWQTFWKFFIRGGVQGGLYYYDKLMYA